MMTVEQFLKENPEEEKNVLAYGRKLIIAEERERCKAILRLAGVFQPWHVREAIDDGSNHLPCMAIPDNLVTEDDCKRIARNLGAR